MTKHIWTGYPLMISLAALLGIEDFCVSPEMQHAYWYRRLNRDEHIRLVDRIRRENDLRAFPPRDKEAFEAIYRELLAKYCKTGDLRSIIRQPCRISIFPWRNSTQYLRLYGNFIVPKSRSLRRDIKEVLRIYLCRRYLWDIPTIYEFGCGSGINLIKMARIFNNTKILYGSDFAPACADIINEVKVRTGYKIASFVSDIREKCDVDLEPNSAVVTFCALEQVGSDYKEFVAYLLRQKPTICINQEPIDDFYDNSELGRLAKEHHEAQGYLTGYLSYLKGMESKGLLKIIKAQYVPFGYTYHEGYSYIVWKPI